MAVEMKGRVFLSGILSAGVFVFAGELLNWVVGSRGFEDWKGAGFSLSQLTPAIEEMIEEEGSRPDETRVNQVIKAVVEERDGEEFVLEEGHPDYRLYRLAEEIAGETRFDLWKGFPIYAEKNELPNGFGFYLVGEDGISESAGDDKDDLNSWDGANYEYYEERFKWRRLLVIGLIALVPALLSFFLLLRFFKSKELEKLAMKIVRPLVFFVGIPLGGLMVLGFLFGFMLFGFPWEDEGKPYPLFSRALPETATEVNEWGVGTDIPYEYTYRMRGRIDEREFFKFCEKFELTPLAERDDEEAERIDFSWEGNHPGCGGWWIPSNGTENTFLWQKRQQGIYAKHENGYLYFHAYKY